MTPVPSPERARTLTQGALESTQPAAPVAHAASRRARIATTSLLALGPLFTLPSLAADQESGPPQETPPAAQDGGEQPHNSAGPGGSSGSGGHGLIDDVKAYVTSPLHWDGTDWLYFGGALAAIGIAHHYDAQVRSQYAPATLPASNRTYDLQDIAPTAALLAGTFGLAELSDDSTGKKEGWAMLEAATFSAGASYAFKFAAGREAPFQTGNPDLLGRGGSSFPSLHSTLAFAVGTVMAESGNDDYRWLRRALGYGVGIFTSYERIKHDQHWLSDTVAGAALGAATARFVMHRRYDSDDGSTSGVSVIPESGGMMLTYTKTF